MENNLYPLNGADFSEPQSQINEREQEIADTLKAIPLLEEIVQHLDESIAALDSVAYIPDFALFNTKKYMHITAGNKKARNLLIVERDYILARVENTKK